MTPDVSLSYSSEGGPSWAGLGWDLSSPEVAVDTSFGAPRFCDGFRACIWRRRCASSIAIVR